MTSHIGSVERLVTLTEEALLGTVPYVLCVLHAGTCVPLGGNRKCCLIQKNKPSIYGNQPTLASVTDTLNTNQLDAHKKLCSSLDSFLF